METTTKRHPIRAFLYGIPFGLGLALIVVGQGIAALGTWPPFIVLVAGIVAATLWGMYGPAKAPKGPPPAGETLVDDTPPQDPEPVSEPDPVAEPAGDGEADGMADEPADNPTT